ncbi:DNA gyrase inhibitor YacG [bacterium]|nr:DNA gyrase inhibitor YacG [bacterium]
MKEEDTWKCSYCGKPTARGNAYFPFCSQRCKMADLGRWMLEDYKIAEPLPEEGEAPADESEPAQ